MLSIPTVAFSQEGVTIEQSDNRAVIGIPSIDNGTVLTVSLNQESGFLIRSLELGAANSVEQVEVIIEVLEEKPGDVDAPGTVHNYIMITTSNLSAEDLMFAKINFGISKIWMEENGVEKTTVGILGIFEGEWSIISSTQELEDTADEVMFTSDLPHLSFLNYAVSGKLPSVTTTATETTTTTMVITTDTATVTTTATPTVTTTMTIPGEGVGNAVYQALVIAVIALAILAFVYRKSREAKKESQSDAI
jgi:PGF-pre-PGF domain-containing protein|tara:strand:- start:379 stop:1125 length:747 start_codon:yes stop_codon:yes gene_type:complete